MPDVTNPVSHNTVYKHSFLDSFLTHPDIILEESFVHKYLQFIFVR